MSDPYRPLLHFAPRRHWANDPNGLVFHEGRWHLFFQHNPNGDGWGDLSWGHAVSDDLVSWDERPVAIIETVESRIVRLADVDDRHAIDEGEGYANAAAFRAAHERFWNGYIDDLRTRIGPDFTIDDDTLVVLKRFRVVERLDPD